MIRIIFILIGLWVGMINAQVPHVEPNYALNVAEWWQQHPYNPASKNYQAQINSPQPIIYLKSGQSINAAIARLPASGGTIQLGPGVYKSFQIIGRSHIHISAEPGAEAVIQNYFSLAPSNELLKFVRMRPKEQDLYLLQHKTQLVSQYATPPTDIFLKGLIFDGENEVNRCLTLVRSQDVLLEACAFINFTYQRPEKKSEWPGYRFIWGYDMTNLWFRKCTFSVVETSLARFSHSHACGFTDCASRSASVMLSGDYLVMYNNTFRIYSGGLAHIHGSNAYLCHNNQMGTFGNLVYILEQKPSHVDLLQNQGDFNFSHGLDIHVQGNRAHRINSCLVVIRRNKYHPMEEEPQEVEKTIFVKDNASTNIQNIPVFKILDNEGFEE